MESPVAFAAPQIPPKPLARLDQGRGALRSPDWTSPESSGRTSLVEARFPSLVASHSRQVPSWDQYARDRVCPRVVPHRRLESARAF